MKTALIIALLTLSAVASAQVDDYGRPVKQEHKPVDFTKSEMEKGSGGWIFTDHKNPVLHERREKDWTATSHKNPVRWEQQKKKNSIFGSVQD